MVVVVVIFNVDETQKKKIKIPQPTLWDVIFFFG